MFTPGSISSKYTQTTPVSVGNGFVPGSISSRYTGGQTPTIQPTSNIASDWLGIKNPTTYFQDAFKQFGDVITHPIQAIKNTVGAAVNAIVQPIKNVWTANKEIFAPNQTVIQRTADILHSIGADAAVVFSPISAAFAAAEQLPILKEAADILQMPFAITGKIGDFAAEKFISVLPISQESKDILAPAFGEVGALAGQILLGGKIMDMVIKGIKPDKIAIDEAVRDTKTKVDIAKTEALKTSETPFVPGSVSSKYVLQPLVQEATKYKSAEEFVKAQFEKKPEYGMSHRPSYDGMPPAYNLLEGETLPRDVYTHPDYSISSGRIKSGDKAANESWDALQKIKGKPDAEITVYRAGRADKLNNGDWVTFSKDYAKQSLEGDVEKVYSFKVKAKDVIFAGDDINEFGYYPKSQLTDFYQKATKGVTEVVQTKPSGVALSIEAKAIEKGLIDKGYADLAGYDASTIKAQAELGAKYGIEEHIKFATGEESLPQGMKPATALSIAEDYAMETKNGELAAKLAHSPLATQISESASAVSLSRMRTPDSATAKIREVNKELQRVAERNLGGKTAEKIKGDIKKTLADKIAKAKPSKYDLMSLLDQIKC